MTQKKPKTPEQIYQMQLNREIEQEAYNQFRKEADDLLHRNLPIAIMLEHMQKLCLTHRNQLENKLNTKPR